MESGHYELDLVISRKSKSALLVMIDRLTRETIIRKIKNKSSVSVNRSISEKLLKNQVKTITTDNGTEFSKLNSLESYNLKVYYCNPYASWQKGSVGNVNRIIRRYVSKSTDIKLADYKKIKDVEREINNLPRMIFGGLSSNDLKNV